MGPGSPTHLGACAQGTAEQPYPVHPNTTPEWGGLGFDSKLLDSRGYAFDHNKFQFLAICKNNIHFFTHKREMYESLSGHIGQGCMEEGEIRWGARCSVSRDLTTEQYAAGCRRAWVIAVLNYCCSQPDIFKAHTQWAVGLKLRHGRDGKAELHFTEKHDHSANEA